MPGNKTLFRRIRRRSRSLLRGIGGVLLGVVGLVPPVLAGAGVFLVVAGLFFYFQSPSTNPAPSSPVSVSSQTLYSLPPVGSAAPSAAGQKARATRLVIPELGIDLPIIVSPDNEEFPLCDVAEIMGDMGFPGSPGPTYVYAHARDGMFGPLLAQSKVNDGSDMIGMCVEVYTSDNLNHVYEITKVIRGVPADAHFLDGALQVKSDQFWMQTSEGPYSTSTKLQVVATPVGILGATSTDAHPTGTGIVCAQNVPKCTHGGSGCVP